MEPKFTKIDHNVLVKHLLNESNAVERESVNNWILEHPSHEEYYKQLKTLWDHSHKLSNSSNVDVSKAWQNFQYRITKKTQQEKLLKINPLGWLKIVAVLAFLVSISRVTYLSINKKNAPEVSFVKTSHNVLTDTLNDGSIITLNQKSMISYPSKFTGKTRPVTLQGEAFFRVAHNAKKPFIITVNNIQVTVLGTSFNVNTKIGYTEIIVETGTVKVTKDGNTVTLSPREKLYIPEGNNIGTKEPVIDRLYNYYRTKEFVCDDTPLWKLVQVLNEAYNANIHIGKKEFQNYKLNSTFSNQSLDKILEVIHLTFDIEVVKQKGQIILK
jgi:transmembrane sensor